MKRTITIIGSGMMGSALAFPAFENGNEVRLVGTPLDKEIIEECKRSGKHPKFDRPFPKGVEYFQFEDWQEAVKGADFVIGGVSSFGVDWFLNEVLAYLDPAMPVLSVTKGLINLEDGTLISYPAYWKTELLKKGIRREVNAIGGPCTSYELVFHDQTEVAFCGKDTAVIKMMKEAMQTSYYHISTTNDVIGLESAVALKNAYALGIALTIGLVNRQHGAEAGLHYNSQAGAFYQATKEMTKMMALVMKNSAMNERHISMKLALFITASTMPSSAPVSSRMGTPTTNCFFSYTPTVLRPSYSPLPDTIFSVISAGTVTLWPARSLSVVSSTCPSAVQMRKITSVMREATPASVRSASS